MTAEGENGGRNMYEILLNFFIYGFFGWCTEVAFAAVKERKFVNRGFLNGPICPIYGIGVTVVVSLLMPYKDQILVLYLWSVLLVTVLEGVTGYLLEKLFHHRWWDYTGMPLNIGGHVCLLFSVIWGVACVAIVHWVHPFVRWMVSFVPVWLGWTILAAFGFVLVSDLYVTVTGILKFNRRLAHMEAIAQELHRISDQLGENIYKNTMEGVELQDRVKTRAEVIRQKAEDATEEMRQRTERATEEMRQRTERVTEEMRQRTERAVEEVRQRRERTVEEARQRAEQYTDTLGEKYQELRARYQELAENLPPVSRRLLDAFPTMKPRRYEKQFDRLKEHRRQRRERKRK